MAQQLIENSQRQNQPFAKVLLCNQLLAYGQIRQLQEAPPTIPPATRPLLLSKSSYNHTLGYYCISWDSDETSRPTSSEGE